MTVFLLRCMSLRLAQSGHEADLMRCPLLTQSGNRPLQCKTDLIPIL
jgi:hypothetical protein